MIPFTQHPCLPPVTDDMVRAIVAKHGSRAPIILAEIERKRVETIQLAEADPLEHGWVFPHWRDALEQLSLDIILLCLFGGNGSGKTWFAMWELMRTMFAYPGCKVLCLHEAEQSSQEVHHAIAYQFLPPSIKPKDNYKVKNTVNTQIAYNNKTGFTGNAFSIPNGSKMVFGYYTQKVKLYEGTGWKRIFFDEDAPLSWINTLLVRLPRAKGKAIWSFTAIDGITPAIASVTKGAVTLKARPVDSEVLPVDHRVTQDQDWPVGTMPYLQESIKEGVRTMYFHTELNPLPEGQYKDMKRLAKSMDVVWRERRLYGVTRDNMRSLCNFTAAHKIKRERMAEILAKPCTRYHVLDPASNRNCFQIWFAVDVHGRHYIYREWPDVPHYGEWALPSDDSNKWDGKPGPAQNSLKYGITDYKRQILEAEGWSLIEGVWHPYTIQSEIVDGQQVEKRVVSEQIFARYIDPRSGNVDSVAEESGESSLIDRFGEEQRDHLGLVSGPCMDFEPAYSGRAERDGIMLINELLAYNKQEPITALLNEPMLYVSEDCKNTIWALQNYTGHDGEKAACKDPMDDVRYAVLKKCQHYTEDDFRSRGGGAY
jgi:hypothetical protein